MTSEDRYNNAIAFYNKKDYGNAIDEMFLIPEDEINKTIKYKLFLAEALQRNRNYDTAIDVAKEVLKFITEKYYVDCTTYLIKSEEDKIYTIRLNKLIASCYSSLAQIYIERDDYF